jgi:hypothetical protein
VSCKGKGCKFKKKSVTAKKAQTVKLTKYFNVKKKGKKTKVAKLKAKAKVSIIVTKKNTFGNWFEATIQKGQKFPKTKQGCLAVGSSKTHVKCPKG